MDITPSYSRRHAIVIYKLQTYKYIQSYISKTTETVLVAVAYSGQTLYLFLRALGDSESATKILHKETHLLHLDLK